MPSLLQFNNGAKPDEDKKMITIISALAIVLLSSYSYNALLTLRIGTLAYWSYLVSSFIYPESGKKCLILGLSLFSFILLSTFIPGFLFPKIKLAASLMNIPPQLHVLFILHRRVAAHVPSESFKTVVRFYTAFTIFSITWTVGWLVKQIVE